MAAYLVCFKLKDDKKLNNEIVKKVEKYENFKLNNFTYLINVKNKITVDSLADEISPLLDTEDDFLISYICIPNISRRDTKLHEWANKHIDSPPEPLINEFF